MAGTSVRKEIDLGVMCIITGRVALGGDDLETRHDRHIGEFSRREPASK
jgi:hypothetical protein